MLKVLIVDDQKTVQALLNDYLISELSLDIVGFADDGQTALEMVKVHQPDIVLMDIEMPILDGLTTTKIITEQFVQSSVLILSVHDDDNYLSAALQVGAKGYLLKTTPAKELINAIYSANKGYFQLGPGLLEKYLYKITQSKFNFNEIEKLKTVISQQSILIEKFNSEKQENNLRSEIIDNNDKLEADILALEQKIYYLNSYATELKKKVLYVQNSGLLLCFALVILILITYL